MNIVVTGASRGIGLELCSIALKRGDRVLAVAREPGASPELGALRAEFAERLEILAADLVEPDAAARIAAALANWPGVDVLINNAGVYRQGEALEDFLGSFHVNSVAPLQTMRALSAKLKASKKPKVIQITSLMGSIGDNTSGGSYAYRASKAALNMITKCVAQDEKWLIAALVHPGWVKTRMGGAGAPTSVAESAQGIWRLTDRLELADSGAFFDYEGERLPW